MIRAFARTENDGTGGRMATMFSSGEGYEGMMGRHSIRLAPLFADFAGVRDAGSILDVGCGTGSLTHVLAQRTREAKITGIDPSKGFVEHARKRFAASPRIKIDEGSATELPYPNATFDQTLTLLVLQFIAESAKAVSELARVTRPRGTVAACVWEARGQPMGTTFEEEAAKLDPSAVESRRRVRPNAYVEGQLTQAWKRAGLKDVSETRLRISMDFDSFEHYWHGQVHGSGPQTVYIASLPAEHLERLRLAMRKRHLGDRPDGPYKLDAEALAVKGVVPE
jgi:SAM-dependent methyltransferase